MVTIHIDSGVSISNNSQDKLYDMMLFVISCLFFCNAQSFVAATHTDAERGTFKASTSVRLQKTHITNASSDR